MSALPVPAADLDTDESAIRAAFDAQAATALAWRHSTAAERRQRIARLRSALMARREQWYAAFDADLRKPAVEVELTELLPVVDEARHAIGQLRRWMRPQRVWPTLATLGTHSRVLHQPRGRCLIVGPWNYPVNTLLGPLVSALAAGNTVILKPSEFTPHVNAVVAETVRDAFAPHEVTVIEGGVATAERLLALPFDHVFFTGSPAVGKIVMAAAARHLTSVTLELGGKSPVIIDASADLEQAVQMLVWGKTTNAGQTCVAPDHVYVHRSVEARFVQRWRETVAARLGADDAAIAASRDYGRLIHARHAERLIGLLDDARSRGARVLSGGGHDRDARFLSPTLLAGVPDDARIEDEEIFGPLLPLRVFDSLDEPIARINAGAKPLALYLFSSDRASVDRVSRETTSGGLGVNLCMQQYAHGHLPFGGVGRSGIGNAHGFYGFRAFSHERAVIAAGPFSALKLFFPPYTETTHRLSRALVNWLAR